MDFDLLGGLTAGSTLAGTVDSIRNISAHAEKTQYT